MEAQFILKRLILKELEVNDRKVYIPTTTPRLPMPKIDRSGIMQEAFSRRHDYQAVLLDADKQQIALRFARNQMYPQLDVVGTYGLNGLKGNYGDAFDQAFDGHTPEWTAGLQLQIPFGFVKERAQLNAAKGLQLQAILQIKQKELSVGVDIDTIISRLITNQQRVETARLTTAFQEETVRVASRRLAEGQLSSFEYIDQAQKLGNLKSQELAILADFNANVLQFWHFTGTLLDREGIYFDK